MEPMQPEHWNERRGIGVEGWCVLRTVQDTLLGFGQARQTILLLRVLLARSADGTM